MSAQTPIEDTSLETFQNVINVNLVGTFLCTREAVRIFKAQTPQGGTCALQHLCSPRSHADDRENHQQRIDLRIHAAPAFVPLHFVEARSAGHDQVHSARRKSIQHHLHAGRHWRVIHLNHDRGYDSHTSPGGAPTTMSPPPQGALQPDGRRIPEAVFDAKHVGETIVHIASLPLDVTVLTFNIMCVGAWMPQCDKTSEHSY